MTMMIKVMIMIADDNDYDYNRTSRSKTADKSPKGPQKFLCSSSRNPSSQDSFVWYHRTCFGRKSLNRFYILYY